MSTEFEFVKTGVAREDDFLAGAGEMATRTRLFDWTTTALGAPANWPAPLKAMVRMMLATRHPAYIFWGPERVCLYNDAYRVSLGAEKHPSSLGASGRSAWPEMWAVIGPQIKSVMQGKGSTWHENQCLPFVRNGQMTDVYWTYSFGPIDDDSAPSGVGGVLALCTETTEQIQSARRTEQEQKRFAQLFDQAPSFMALLSGPSHVFELANPGYRRLVGSRKLIGRAVAEAIPEATDQGFVARLDEVFLTGKVFKATGVQFNVQTTANGPYLEKFLDFVFQPTVGPAGEVTGVFVEGVDVTDRQDAEQSLLNSEARFRMAVESSGLGTFNVELDSRRLTLSANARDILGLHEPDLTLDDALRWIHPADIERVRTTLDQVAVGGENGHVRILYRLTPRPEDSRTVSLSGRLL